MKFILSVFVILFLANCSKPKTVLICGDHICVNKAEADEHAKALQDAGATAELK